MVVDRDLVGQRAGVFGVALGQRNALVEPQDLRAFGVVVLRDDGDVADVIQQLAGDPP